MNSNITSNTSVVNEQVAKATRLVGRQLARALSAEEVVSVSGGMKNESWSEYQGNENRDDCHA